MPLTIKQIVAETPRKNKLGERKLAATKPNLRAELNYASELREITSYIQQQTKEILLPVLKEEEKNYGYQQDSFTSRIQTALALLAKLVGIRANTKARYIAARAVFRSKQATDKQLIQAAQSSLGVDLSKALSDDPLKSVLAIAIAANTDLIKSLPTQYMTQLRTMVLDGVQKGRRFEALAEDIKGRWNVVDNRARLIARDQTAKLNSAITEARQTQLGITHYKWQTSGDERVRTTHESNDGKIFAWNDPPATGHPGQDVQCRCVAIPVFNL